MSPEVYRYRVRVKLRAEGVCVVFACLEARLIHVVMTLSADRRMMAEVPVSQQDITMRKVRGANGITQTREVL